jgi:hypothetical protein
VHEAAKKTKTPNQNIQLRFIIIQY